MLTVALAVFPVISGLLTSTVGWRWALAPYSIALVTAVATWFLLDPTHEPTQASIREQLGGVRLALGSSRIITIVLGGGISFGVIFGVFLAAYPNHLDTEFGLGAGRRGLEDRAARDHVVDRRASTSVAPAAVRSGHGARRVLGGVDRVVRGDRTGRCDLVAGDRHAALRVRGRAMIPTLQESALH